MSDGAPGDPSGARLPPPHGGLLRRVIGFAGLPFIALATPLLFLPVLARIAGAEAWLAIAPNSPALLTTLGRLCRDQQLWGKAIQYLDRATALDGTSLAWEALGDCHAGKGDERLANRCYSNALHAARGEAVTALANQIRGPLDTHALIVEERDQHGVPRLPKAS
jgi:HemY protein